eukprot:GHVU01137728.1.p1 GENE.GHVU01137728.1~~GHVU01137728.1.p1  ORF type:complete len:484 (-),score=73.78 GHVU01137728.1:572-2023(-)
MQCRQLEESECGGGMRRSGGRSVGSGIGIQKTMNIRKRRKAIQTAATLSLIFLGASLTMMFPFQSSSSMNSSSENYLERSSSRSLGGSLSRGFIIGADAARPSAGRDSQRLIEPGLGLLPWTDPANPSHRPQLQLEAYGGCYRWETQRSDIVSLEEGQEKRKEGQASCTNTVIARAALARQPTGRERSYIMARDTASNFELRSEVSVAMIKKIVIETLAERVDVGGVEVLAVRAYDENGNVFSTLESLWFQWGVSDSSVLQPQSLDVGELKMSEARLRTVKEGAESDVLVMRGMATGVTTVTVRLRERGYESVPPASVTLGVSEPFLVEPFSLIVPPAALIKMGLRILKEKVAVDASPLVPLPSRNFKFFAHPSVASFRVDANDNGEVRVGSRNFPADVEVVVSDTRIANATHKSVVVVSVPNELRAHMRRVSEVYPSLLSVVRLAVKNELSTSTSTSSGGGGNRGATDQSGSDSRLISEEEE